MRVFVWGSKQGREKGALNPPFSGCPSPQAIEPCGGKGNPGALRLPGRR